MGKGAPDGVMDAGRVLVVGVNCAPEHSGDAPYTSRLAEHLAVRGMRKSPAGRAVIDLAEVVGCVQCAS